MHPTDDEGDTGAAMEMPRYVSHKKVWALEIEDIGADNKLYFKEKGYAPVVAPVEMFSRYVPKIGDFYV